MISTSEASPPGRTFFGHPWGLSTLFMTEMWERFSYYGMRALLAVYLAAPVSEGGLGFPTSTAIAIFSVYLSMVYLLTLPGGWVSDRFLGPRKSVTVACVIIMIGHFLLAVPTEGFFFAGLFFVAVGSGLVKANISTMVGHLYQGALEWRRDSAFTIFYMGINLGAFFAPLVIGTIGQKVGYHLGFAVAGVGMALGLVQYLLGRRSLSPHSDLVPAPLDAAQRAALVKKGLLWLLVPVVFYAVVVLSGHYTLNWVVVPLTIIGLVFPAWTLFRIRRDPELTVPERQRMTAYVWLFVAAAIFWMIYDQGGSTLNIFAAKNTDTTFAGIDFPSSWFQSLNPLFIMALGPVFAWLWQWLAARHKEPSTPAKFAVGLILVGLSFVVFLPALAAAANGNLVSPLWLCAIYLVQTVGELCLSPVGLSVTTKLAPEKYGSQMMGVWFLAVTAGDCVTSLASLAGANLDGRPFVVAEVTVAVVVGLVILLFRKQISSRFVGHH
ncbi:peptide MFS transporter [Streptomyces sp. NBC_00259]|uniref:peptide MFS transporter n=1 Tax=Streptomyces sp. NBC_00259 TaxID=2903643 RepID=UPI002E2DAE1F|nr:oligopeptide:H+ symporter [Streptomyces sp. NBC_00259]